MGSLPLLSSSLTNRENGSEKKRTEKGEKGERKKSIKRHGRELSIHILYPRPAHFRYVEMEDERGGKKGKREKGRKRA